ncbi:MAG: HAD-IIA family hydrolase [Prolixibacteraceae bacterium]
MKIKSFDQIASNYKTVFFDAFGVLKNHKGLIPGIERTFEFLDKRGIDYYILTNDASRSPADLANWYQSRNIDCITADRIISSGMLAHDWLNLKIKSGKVAYLGTEQSAHYIETAGLETMPISNLDLDDVDDIKCLVFLDDEGFDWNNDINKVINLLRKKNMPVIVANTDQNYPVSRTDIAIAVGGLSDMVEKILGKHFIRFGKPDAQMFMFGYEKACLKQPLQRDDILMVGDTLFTDIIGGNKFGMDTVLVLSGNTLAENAKMKIRSTGIIPTYICESIVFY